MNTTPISQLGKPDKTSDRLEATVLVDGKKLFVSIVRVDSFTAGLREIAATARSLGQEIPFRVTRVG